jgi:hypothetical protein
MQTIIEECPTQLDRVKNFKPGGAAQVKASMAKPTDMDLLTKAFEAIVPNALIVKGFNDFAETIGRYFFLLYLYSPTV